MFTSFPNSLLDSHSLFNELIFFTQFHFTKKNIIV